mmetsp:Transcript_81631/g.219348  ORF Transcript_81631/g.219348 Transcript_81631/m.219348 type:complete len:141 (-) Transcript_81631:94-516(-)
MWAGFNVPSSPSSVDRGKTPSHPESKPFLNGFEASSSLFSLLFQVFESPSPPPRNTPLRFVGMNFISSCTQIFAAMASFSAAARGSRPRSNTNRHTMQSSLPQAKCEIVFDRALRFSSISVQCRWFELELLSHFNNNTRT